MAVAVAAAAVAVAALMAADARVVDEDVLLPWGLPAREVESLGIRFYVDWELQPRLDVATTWVLAAIGSIAAFAALLIGRGALDRDVPRFLVLAAAGAWWLGADEALGLHESIGHNLPFLAEIPGVTHPDDVLPGLYVIAGLAFAVAFRRIVTSSRTAVKLWAAAVLLAVVAAAADISGALPDRVEDGCELAAVGLVLVGFAMLARDLVRRELPAPLVRA